MRVRHLLRRLGGSSGQSTVEFAILVPLFCVLLILSVYAGRAVLFWLDATHLANVGARAAAVDNWPTKGSESLASWIRGQALWENMPNSQDATVAICAGAGGSVRVTVSYTAPMLPAVGWADLTLNGASEMRFEPAAAAPYPECTS